LFDPLLLSESEGLEGKGAVATEELLAFAESVEVMKFNEAVHLSLHE